MINAKICFFNEREVQSTMFIQKKYWNFTNTNPVSPSEMVRNSYILYRLMNMRTILLPFTTTTSVLRT